MSVLRDEDRIIRGQDLSLVFALVCLTVLAYLYKLDLDHDLTERAGIESTTIPGKKIPRRI